MTIGVIGELWNIFGQFKRVGSMGVLIEEALNALDLMSASSDTNDGLFALWIGPKPLVIVYDAQFVEQIITSKDKVRKGPIYEVMQDWFGGGLITSNGHKWTSRRKLLLPAFSVRKLDASLTSLNSNTNRLLKLLQEQANSSDSQMIHDLRQPVAQFALSNVIEFALDTRSPFPSESADKYIHAVEKVHASLYHRAILSYLAPLFRYTCSGKRYQQQIDVINDFTSQLILDRTDKLRAMKTEPRGEELNEVNDENVKRSVIDILLCEHMKAPDAFTMQDVHEEVSTTMIAGFDTAAAFITWTTYLLGLHRQVQETMQNELDAMFDAKDRTTDDLTMSDLRSLPYTEAVIKESHRIYSTVVAISRLVEEDTQLGEHVIPAGTEVVIPIFAVHKSPRYWCDPAKFDPHRFLSGHQVHPPSAFLPFSGGPRSCIGQKYAQVEVKVALAKMFHRFTVTSLDPVDKLRIHFAVARRTVDPVRVKLTPRN